MSDKELIKQEIERRIDLYSIAEKDDSTFARMGELSSLMDFIDSLPEEPASEDLEEELRKILNKHYYFPDEDDELRSIPELAKYIAFHFAEWQKQKDFKELLKSDMTQFKKCYEKGKADAMKEMKETLQTEYEKGRFDMREEMMKDAVEGTVVSKERSTMPPFQTKCKIVADRVAIDAEEGDKVKLSIINNKR